MSSSAVQLVGCPRAPGAPTIIGIRGQITPATAAEAKRKAQQAGATGDLVFRLNTPGGSVAAALEIAGLARSHRGMTAAIVEETGGRCDSAALFVLAACRRRNAGPECCFRFHPVALDPAKIDGRLTSAVLRRAAAANARLDDLIAASIAGWISAPTATVAALIRDEVTLDARSALDLGLLTRVPGHPEWWLEARRARREREALAARSRAEIADSRRPLTASDTAALARQFCRHGGPARSVILGISAGGARALLEKCETCGGSGLCQKCDGEGTDCVICQESGLCSNCDGRGRRSAWLRPYERVATHLSNRDRALARIASMGTMQRAAGSTATKRSFSL